MIAGHDLGYCWSGPEHLPGCATSVDDIENADPEERKRASEVHEFTKTFFAGSSRIFLGGRTQTSSAVYAASSVRHRCFAHCKELSNNKSKTSHRAKPVLEMHSDSKGLMQSFGRSLLFAFRLAGHSVQKLSGLEKMPDCHPKEEPDRSSYKCNQHDRSRRSDRFSLWVPG